MNAIPKPTLPGLLTLPSKPPILKSKRFWSFIVGAAMVWVSAQLPELKPYTPQIIEAVAYAVVFLISGYSLQDAVKAGVEAFLNYKENGDDE